MRTKKGVVTIVAFVLVAALIAGAATRIYAPSVLTPPTTPAVGFTREEYDGLKTDLESFKADLEDLLKEIDELKKATAESPTVSYTTKKGDSYLEDTPASYHPMLYFVFSDYNHGRGSPIITGGGDAGQDGGPDEGNNPVEVVPGVPEFGFSASTIASLTAAVYLALRKRRK